MALQSSGPISLNNVAGEFGGSTPHSLSEYYGVDDGVPGSGTISLSNFYGKSVTAPEPEPEPEPNLPFRQTGFGGQIYRANYESTPGFPAATNRDKYYCLQDSGNPGGPVNGGVFTEGFYKMAWVDPNFGYQGISNNSFNRVSVASGNSPAWDFRDYTRITLATSGGFGTAAWSIVNPVWSSYVSQGSGFSQVIYLSSFTSATAVLGIATNNDTAASIGGVVALNFDAGGGNVAFDWVA